MQNKKNQSNVGQMIQRCHKWRQKRKQYIDQARQTADEIERERLLQTAEHRLRHKSNQIQQNPAMMMNHPSLILLQIYKSDFRADWRVFIC